MDKLIEKFDMVVKIIDVDHVEGNKLKNVNVLIYEEQCANITKEIAVGFMDWYEASVWIPDGKLTGYINLETKKVKSTSELFDLYVKSL